MKPLWRFGNNDTQESEGPNNPGIANFTDDRIGGLVREVLQNSIDARASTDKRVEVSFQVRELPVGDLDLPGLKRALDASRKSHVIDDRHKQQFQRGLQAVNDATKSGVITALNITDSNTTGASDKKGQRDKWHSLTKTVGLSAKDARDSGGSFGIGKHAAFAATDLRTVLYSTAYHEDGADRPIRRRFTGKSILVSHEVGGKLYRASGWLDTLRDSDVPPPFRLNPPGTQINILGFDDSSMEGWEAEATESLVTHFFHALANNNLRVCIGDSTIDLESLNETASGIDDKSVLRLIKVSRSGVLEHTDIQGIGRVNLRIDVDEHGEHGQKTVALVRDAGMMITRQLGNMRITPSQRMIQIPRHWLGFTAIVECLSHGERSLLREAEGPRHDKVSADNADASERKEVSRALRQLGKWVVEAIRKHAEPPPPDESGNADELKDVLPLPGGASQATTAEGRGRWEITKPKQASKAPRGLGTRGGRRKRTTTGAPGSEGAGRNTGTGNGKKPKKPRRQGRRNKPVQVPFHDLRRLPSTLVQWPEHTARFTFDVPNERPMKHVRLYAVGEDGKETQVHLERAYIAGRRVSVKGGEIAEIVDSLITGNRVEIELKAIRPIAGRLLEIKLASRPIKKKVGRK